MKYEVEPIGYVSCGRKDPIDDGWGAIPASIVLDAAFPEESLAGLGEFSHVEVIYLFHKVDPAAVVVAAEHPRENPAWPKVGILAQRKKARPNRLGATICELLAVEGRTLRLKRLDAIDGTPVLDIKPVFREYLPATAVRQPAWPGELMREYW